MLFWPHTFSFNEIYPDDNSISNRSVKNKKQRGRKRSSSNRANDSWVKWQRVGGAKKKKLKKERRKCYLPQVKFKRNTSWSLCSCLSNSSSIREGWLANRDWPDARVETPATGPPTISRQCGSPKVTGAPQGHHQLFARAPIHLDILANSPATTNLCKCNTITSSLTLFFFKSMLHTHPRWYFSFPFPPPLQSDTFRRLSSFFSKKMEFMTICLVQLLFDTIGNEF